MKSLKHGDALTLFSYPRAMFRPIDVAVALDSPRKIFPLLELGGLGANTSSKIIEHLKERGFIPAKSEVVIYMGRISFGGSSVGSVLGMKKNSLYADVLWRGTIYRMSISDISKFDLLQKVVF